MITINYVTGSVGSGKSYSAIKYVAANRTAKYLYCSSSTRLCDQVANELKQSDMTMRVETIFQNGKHQENVALSITHHLRDADDRGEDLVITHAAFECIRFFQSAGRWNIVWDEDPQIIRYKGIRVAQYPDLLLDIVEAPVSVSYSYSSIADESDGGTTDVMLADHTEYSVCQAVRSFAGHLRHYQWNTYVDSEQFEKLQVNRDRSGKGDHRSDCFGLLQQTLFGIEAG